MSVLRCWSCASCPLPLWRCCWTASKWFQLVRSGYRTFQMNYWRSFIISIPFPHSHILFLSFTHVYKTYFWFCCALFYTQEHKPFFDSVWRMIGQPRKLQHLSRCSLRHHLGALCYSAINELNIPSALKEYLLLRIDGEIHWNTKRTLYMNSRSNKMQKHQLSETTWAWTSLFLQLYT